jgi:hypothetical protein
MGCTLIAQPKASQLRVTGVTYPATSRVISRTNAVRLDRKPFLLEILGAGVLGVTSVHCVSIHFRKFGQRERNGGRRGNAAWEDVRWPLFRPTMRPDFCLTSFGMLTVVVSWSWFGW